jgi:hypothetical protein
MHAGQRPRRGWLVCRVRWRIEPPRQWHAAPRVGLFPRLTPAEVPLVQGGRYFIECGADKQHGNPPSKQDEILADAWFRRLPYFLGHRRCLLKNSNVPRPLISWGPSKNSISVLCAIPKLT